jgi:hypothetical protein
MLAGSTASKNAVSNGDANITPSPGGTVTMDDLEHLDSLPVSQCEFAVEARKSLANRSMSDLRSTVLMVRLLDSLRFGICRLQVADQALEGFLI